MEEKGKLGLLPCIGIIVGGCIGSAIFSLSGQTIIYAGPAATISWTVAAVILALYGMQVCELAVRYPRSGGIFVFPQKAIGGEKGNFWGFISAWGYIISNFIAIAFSAITIGNFIENSFPSLSGQKWLIILALCGTLLCMILNLLKISTAGKYNNILVCGLVAALIVFFCLSVFGKRPDGSSAFSIANYSGFFTTGLGIKGMFRAIPVASVAYGACVSISFMVGEVKNPNRTIPSSLVTGLVIVMILYLMTIVATVGTCSYSMFEAYPSLEFAPQFGSIMDGLASYPWLSKLIALSALVALVTTMLVLMALNARAMQAVAISGYLPKVFAEDNSNGVPAFSTVICAAVVSILCLKPEWTSLLVSLGAFFSVFSMAITCVSLIIARKKVPLEKDQYHCPGGTVTPVLTIAILGACYLIGSVSLSVVVFTFIIYTAGIVVFVFEAKKKKRESECAVAFGEFDGVHVGHMAVLDTVLAFRNSAVICISDESKPFLTSEVEKRFIMEDMGVGTWLSIDKSEFEKLSLEDFVSEYIEKRLGATSVVVGENYRRLGELESICRKRKKELLVVPCVKDSNGKVITSEMIVSSMSDGNMNDAIALLGGSYVMAGTVVHGKGMGKKHGMPTANLQTSVNKILPEFGVYGATVSIDDEVYTGMTNVGLRPSVGNTDVPTCETFILDFDQDIYDKNMVISLFRYIRPEKKFNNLYEVRAQIDKDISSISSCKKN